MTTNLGYLYGTGIVGGIGNFKLMVTTTINTFTDTIITYVANGTFVLPSPNSNSLGPFSYTSSDPSVLTISGNVATFQNAGTIVITVVQPEYLNWTKSNYLSANYTVIPAAITFGGFSIPSPYYTTTGLYYIPPPISNSTGSFSYTSTDTSVATISGGYYIIQNIGNTVINATQAATRNYLTGYISTTLVIKPIIPVISGFSVPSPQTYAYGSTVNITPTTSTSPASLVYTSDTPTVATLNGNVISIIGSGTARITVSQVKISVYDASSATATLVVNKAQPQMGPLLLTSQTYSLGGTYSLTTPTTNNPEVSFNYTNDNTGVATISGTTVNIQTAGNTIITATQSQTANFLSGNVSALFTINKANPVFGTFTVTPQTYSLGGTYSLTPPTTNNPVGTFSYVSGNTSVATVSGNTLLIQGAGNSSITATQSSTKNFNSQSVSENLQVSKATPIIGNFSLSTLPYVSGATYKFPIPTTNSPGAFTFTSSNPVISSVSGNTNTLVNAGNVVMTATQAETANFVSGNITANLVITSIPTVITNFTIPQTQFLYGGTITIQNPTTNSPAPFTYTSGNTTVATIVGNTISMLTSGTSQITAYQPPFGNYSLASATTYLVITLANPTIGNLSIPTQTYLLGGTYRLTDPTSNSQGTFTYTSGNTTVATVSGNTVTYGNVGNTLITATQSSVAPYLSGSVTANLQIIPTLPTLGTFSIPTKTYSTNGTVTITAPTSNSTGGFSYTSSNTAIATLNANVITMQNIGTVTITATQAATDNYTTTTTTTTFTIIPIIPTINPFVIPSQTTVNPTASVQSSVTTFTTPSS
jgi:hypothetical protein